MRFFSFKLYFALALLIAMNLFLISCRGPHPDPSDTAAGAPSTIEPPIVPAAPTAAPIPQGTEASQATELATQTDVAATDALAGWMTVYALAGVPIIGPDGVSLSNTGLDPIGPDYWMIWMASKGRPGTGIRLVDAVKPLSSISEAPSVASALIRDLRTAVYSKDTRARFFALFMIEKMRIASHGADPLGPSTDVSALRVDLSTALFLQWVALRATVFSVPLQAAAPAQASEKPRFTPEANRPPCSELWGSQNTTSIINFLVNEFTLGGTKLPGMSGELPTLIGWIQKQNEHLIDPAVFKRVVDLADKVNTVTTLLSLLMQYTTLEGATLMEPMPLVRTKHSGAHGNSANFYFRLSVEPNSLPDGDKIVCAASFLLNAMGITFTSPAVGRVPGAEVIFTGKQGFADRLDTSQAYVLFADETSEVKLKQNLNENGEASIGVKGRSQSTEIPDHANRWDREFSISVEAQPEEENAFTIFNVFYDSLKVEGTRNPTESAVDIAKTVHWDFGEHILPIIDWHNAWHGVVTSSMVFKYPDSDDVLMTRESRLEVEGFVITGSPENDPESVSLTGKAALKYTSYIHLSEPIALPPDGAICILDNTTIENAKVVDVPVSGSLDISGGHYIIQLDDLPGMEAAGIVIRTGCSSGTDFYTIPIDGRSFDPTIAGGLEGEIDPLSPNRISGRRFITNGLGTSFTTEWELTRD
jgi:hypothetical protein